MIPRLFVLFHSTQPHPIPSHPHPHPSKPHQIKQPLSKIAVNERTVCVGNEKCVRFRFIFGVYYVYLRFKNL